MALAKKIAFSPRMKHVDVAYHFFRQYVIAGIIVLEYVPMDENVVDCLTKGVVACKTKFGAKGLGLMDQL